MGHMNVSTPAINIKPQWSTITEAAADYDLVSIQPLHGHYIRFSPYVTLIKPSSSLKVTH